MPILLSLSLIVLIALLVVAIRIAIDVNAIRNELLHDIRMTLRDLSTLQQTGRPSPIQVINHNIPDPVHIAGNPMDFLGTVLWVWRGGEWVANVSEGVDPGMPPSYPGNFEGAKARTW